MTDTPHDLAAVEELLAERDAIHGWLARLDQAGTAAPDSVRSRVRRDYEVRMEGLTDRLRAHADVVAGKLAADRAEHAELVGRATTTREALAEAELRHLVGEFEESRFQEERARHTGDLETFELSLTATAERIGRLEELHRLIAAAPRAAPAQATMTPPSAEPPVPVVEAVELSEDIAEDALDVELEIGDLAQDESDDLLAIFDEVDDLPTPTAPTSDFAPLSFRPSGNAPSEQVRPVTPPLRQNTPPLGMPADVPPRFVRPGEVAAASTPADATSDALFDQDIVAAGSGAEPPASIVGRTLRCGECGAMNRPLEWYCEKCGAELTAL
jgi:hypothetical protein